MLSLKSDKSKCFEYLLFFILLTLSDQSVAENECQKDVSKSAQELLDSFSGINSGQIISQNIPKIFKNPILDDKNQKKVAKLMEHFIMGIDKFMAFLKAKNAFGDQHKDGHYANDLLRRRRRYNEVRERRLKKNGCAFLMMGVLASIACGAFYGPLWHQKSAIPALILCVVYLLSSLIELFIFCR
uniref:Uncharacterized protein n=1 Tax=Globodera rostochiensis TaxID=31243 RepID=A0A914HJT3_GLORO